MAGMLRNAKVWLGLADDDDYDEYEAYDEQPQVQVRGARPYAEAPEMAPPPSSTGSIRAVPRDVRPDDTNGGGGSSGVTVTPRASGSIRPIAPVQSAKVHIVAPERFPDAQDIGDRFKNQQPVIVNLQSADPQLSRRMIDFCSGVTYALGGSMDKVADQVFLLTPSNVEVSAEEKRRLQERGLYRS
jgi:cell division inhibitor SepF